VAYKTRLNIKHNYIKATLKSSHEDIIIEHKLGKKGQVANKKWYPSRIHQLYLHKKPTNNYTLQG
jgi:hypothetical protein